MKIKLSEFLANHLIEKGITDTFISVFLLSDEPATNETLYNHVFLQTLSVPARESLTALLSVYLMRFEGR